MVRLGSIFIVVISLIISFSSLVHSHELGSNKKPLSYGKDQTIVDIDKVVWSPLKMEGLPDGAQFAVLRGDLSKGNSELILKLPAGYELPVHTHTSAETYIWISGAFEFISHDGQVTNYRGPAYISFPGNAPPHGMVCGKKAPCVFYLRYTRPFDIIYPDKKG